jgi:hypothetical protein
MTTRTTSFVDSRNPSSFGHSKRKCIFGTLLEEFMISKRLLRDIKIARFIFLKEIISLTAIFRYAVPTIFVVFSYIVSTRCVAGEEDIK